ncbi:MAG: aminotransferase class V-fold PLP-dependent enzyme [Actinomyces sp.]|nr:MAG: aminotransferase class V-fold PLP-dependent enzyme [Actinomyces sp.]
MTASRSPSREIRAPDGGLVTPGPAASDAQDTPHYAAPVPGRDFIQNPGPTNIPDAVLEAFRRPPVDWADPRLADLVEGLWADLPGLFDTADDVVVYTAVGHGAWEGTFANVAAPGDRLLVATSGLFALAWARMGRDLGYEIETTPVDLRRPPSPDAIGEILARDLADNPPPRRIRAVLVAHTETSTGTRADLGAIRRAIDAAGHDALFVVDAIASLGTDPLSMTDDGIDVVLAASQKGLMMPPGLSLCGLSERAIERSHEVATPRAYWSWPSRLDRSALYLRFGGTPPEQHLYALRAALDLIAGEGGLDAVHRRHRRFAGAVHAAVTGWASDGPWEINAVDPASRSAAVTCIRTGDLDADALIRTSRDRLGVSLGSGMLELAGRAFRFAHMGDLNEPMLLGALGGVEVAMTALGFPHGDGLGPAVAHLGASVGP